MWRTILPSRGLAFPPKRLTALKLGTRAEQHLYYAPFQSSVRSLTASRTLQKIDYEQRAKDLHEKGVGSEQDYSKDPNNTIKQAQELQGRTPWHREGSDTPPVKRMRKSSIMTKGLSIASLIPELLKQRRSQG